MTGILVNPRAALTQGSIVAGLQAIYFGYAFWEGDRTCNHHGNRALLFLCCSAGTMLTTLACWVYIRANSGPIELRRCTQRSAALLRSTEPETEPPIQPPFDMAPLSTIEDICFSAMTALGGTTAPEPVEPLGGKGEHTLALSTNLGQEFFAQGQRIRVLEKNSTHISIMRPDPGSLAC